MLMMAELIKMLGVTRARVAQLTRRPDFPAPIANLDRGRVWATEDIRAWAERTGRQVHPIVGS